MVVMLAASAFLYLENRELSAETLRVDAAEEEMTAALSADVVQVLSTDSDVDHSEMRAIEQAESRLQGLRVALAAAQDRAEPDFDLIKMTEWQRLEAERQAVMAKSSVLQDWERRRAEDLVSSTASIRSQRELIYNSFIAALGLPESLSNSILSELAARDDAQFSAIGQGAARRNNRRSTREIFSDHLSGEQLAEFDAWDQELTRRQVQSRSEAMVRILSGPISDSAVSVLAEGYGALMRSGASSSVANDFSIGTSHISEDDLIELRDWVAERIPQDEMLAVDVFIERHMVQIMNRPEQR
mgnify:CR=1 FL=1